MTFILNLLKHIKKKATRSRASRPHAKAKKPKSLQSSQLAFSWLVAYQDKKGANLVKENVRIYNHRIGNFSSYKTSAS